MTKKCKYCNRETQQFADFCGRGCRILWKKKEYGTQELTEREKELKENESKKEREQERDMLTERERVRLLSQPHKEKPESSNKENITIEQEISKTQKEQKDEEKILNEQENITENFIVKTEQTSLQKLKTGAIEMIPQGDYIDLSLALKEEASGSIKFMDDSARHLAQLAKKLNGAKYDENGEEIRFSTITNVDMAIECYKESRNFMKTKLDFLKFAKDLGGKK